MEKSKKENLQGHKPSDKESKKINKRPDTNQRLQVEEENLQTSCKLGMVQRNCEN